MGDGVSEKTMTNVLAHRTGPPGPRGAAELLGMSGL
jgi:hypothetical protein